MRNVQLLGELSKTVAISDIRVNKNYRMEVEGKLDLLIASIRQIGLLEPIGLVEEGDGTYVVAYGHRRLAACTKLGMKEISAVIRREDKTFNPAMAQLAENFNRTNPTLMEAGQLMKKMVDDGDSIAVIAATVGSTNSKVREAIKNFDGVPDEFKEDIDADIKATAKGRISAGVANAVRRLEMKEGLKKATATKLYRLAKTHGRAFKKGEIKGYVRNIESGKAWNAEGTEGVKDMVLFKITNAEYDRVMAKHVTKPRAKYRSFRHVVQAIVSGRLRERLNLIDQTGDEG